MGGATYGYDQPVPVTATPAVPDGYYYMWEYRWCYNGSAPGDCDYRWYWYDEGPGLSTITPYVYRQDRWVEARVRQYAWSGGPQLGSGQWHIDGAGECTSGCGGGGGGGMLSARTNTTAAGSMPVDTTAAVPRPVQVPAGARPQIANRMRGRAAQRNR